MSRYKLSKEMKKTPNHFNLLFLFLLYFLAPPLLLSAQPIIETGSQKPMPNEWIDKDTYHKVICLTRLDGDNASFYFHNDPFIKQSSNEGDRMIFYNIGKDGKQAYTVNLKTLQRNRLQTKQRQ